MSPLSASANHTPLSPLRFLDRSATVFPDKTAIVHGDRRYTYREFADEVARLARVLRSRIEPGDRIAYLCPNTPEMLMAHFAVPLAGGVLVALNSRLAGPELEYILDHAGVKILFVDSELVGSVRTVRENVGSVVEIVEIPDSTVPYPDVPAGVATARYDEFLTNRDGAADAPLHWGVDDEQQVIAINYTSGTTGKPKGVMYSHRGAYLNSLGETFHNGFDGSTKYLWTLPMFHCNGWCTPWAVTAAAGTHVCLRAVRADAVWDAIDDLGITNLCGAPAVCTTIAGAERAHRVDALRITTAGAPPSPTVIGQLEALGITVVHVYGLTEVYGPYTICEYQQAWDDCSPEERAALISRQGVGMVQAENARVVDENMADVPADGETMGEIVLRGNNVMLGYYRDPDATAEAFAGGWFHTGDLGVMHPDGYIQLKDRAKDIVISGGENISTVEVEQAIMAHPAVLDVAVVGVPHEKWGERPKAYVILKKGAAATAEEIIEHTRSRIARFKVPEEIVFPLDLPRTPTGKVLKFELRALG
ncbi:MULTISPECIES: acyl--CoA ligase family protein [Prescottella]|uniref:AMP-binding protein n=1 Tax=Rhodococcus hoagii TaxID=43767 RepID=A0A9Q4ZMG1_RHOHA|nr:acyl--CoA ligase family protein [Prescottella equi]MCD7050917.1 acyl--CoA ligase family protein [Rhodococcus sp. BH2-1]MBM4472074.1 AMP-binding protein [Prescottella equi]MBM4491118.1 AMP-binding protein [Prescottella equi]MBM4502073.1 AMP-binding protein [Prescottella equi]MBM4505838.1 AMP-binding protein [Prescottella equi]